MLYFRIDNLDNIHTNQGKGRAWLRIALNEQSLSKYLNILLNDAILIRYTFNKIIKDFGKKIRSWTTVKLLAYIYTWITKAKMLLLQKYVCLYWLSIIYSNLQYKIIYADVKA